MPPLPSIAFIPTNGAIASIALLSVALSAPVLAADGEKEQTQAQAQASAPQPSAENLQPHRHAADGFDHRMKPVANEAAANTLGHGWRYFSDPAARRAVVISPQGDYYFSRGKGLRWVAAEQI